MTGTEDKNDSWARKFRKDWETLCLQALGQKKYNETRHLKSSHEGIKPYADYIEGWDDNDSN